MSDRKYLSRGLRFTLTSVYTVLFTVLLLGVSLLFRESLQSNLDAQAYDDLNQSWDVVIANLRIQNDPPEQNYHAVWFLDLENPDEAALSARIKSIYIVADSSGRPIPEVDGTPSFSALYRTLGFDASGEIRQVLASKVPVWIRKTDARGVPYLIRQWYITSEDHSRRYFVAIGRSYEESAALIRKFTLLIIGLIPAVIVTGYVTGWIFAGRALTPVLEIARAAQRIGGSNLSMRIPSSKAGDELDYLVETFNQMIERLEVSFNQIRQFSTDVSHELRTPITVVRGQLEVALFTARTADQYREAIVNSLADIERLSQIVRALLLLSQAETGQVVLQKQLLDLVELAADTTDQFQIPAEGADVRLTFIAKSAHCAGEFDRVQIERMLSNLLSNAIKFTPPGGAIRVEVDRDGSEAVMVVEDSGQGIPGEHLPLIFDRFYRVRGPGEQASPEKGLGLGLSFVAWIVRAHGGTVDVRSEPRKGTVFCIRLPLGNGVAMPDAGDVPASGMNVL